MHTDKLSGPGGRGALNDYPTPPSSFFSLADIRGDMTPSSVPLQLSPPLWGDISISMYPFPSPPRPPNMTSLHTCPTSAPQRLCWGLTMQWKCVRLWVFVTEMCRLTEHGWDSKMRSSLSCTASALWWLGMSAWYLRHISWRLNFIALYLTGQIAGIFHFDQLPFQQHCVSAIKDHKPPYNLACIDKSISTEMC